MLISSNYIPHAFPNFSVASLTERCLLSITAWKWPATARSRGRGFFLWGDFSSWITPEREGGRVAGGEGGRGGERQGGREGGREEGRQGGREGGRE